MGCGDDWPLCNGQVLPALDSAETVIEFGHRLAVLGLGALAAALAIVAWRTRREPGAAGRGGTLAPALIAVGLLVVQSLLGALAVKLELPPHTVVLHLGTGLALLATLVVLGLRAGVLLGTTVPPGAGLPSGGILAAGVLGALVVLMGGMTATTGASSACIGFPLCNGQVWPAAGTEGLQHIHWTHRLLAYGLVLHLLGLGLGLRRNKAPRRLGTAAWTAFGLAAAQVAAGAMMVLAYLPPFWRGLHAALGTAVWVALVYATWVARGRRPATEGSGP